MTSPTQMDQGRTRSDRGQNLNPNMNQHADTNKHQSFDINSHDTSLSLSAHAQGEIMYANEALGNQDRLWQNITQ